MDRLRTRVALWRHGPVESLDIYRFGLTLPVSVSLWRRDSVERLNIHRFAGRLWSDLYFWWRGQGRCYISTRENIILQAGSDISLGRFDRLIRNRQRRAAFRAKFQSNE